MQDATTILSQDQLIEKLKAFKAQFGSHFRLISLGFFGSYARNQATLNSDVDIVFQTDIPDMFLASEMRQELEQILHRPVSVFRLHSGMNLLLRERIEQEAMYV